MEKKFQLQELKKIKMKFYAIGLMSGTSLDGLDICYVCFEKKSESWSFEILNAETISYSKNWEKKLQNSFCLSAPDLMQLHSEYGFYLGSAVENFISEKKIKNLDVISSHGHTVFHQPKKKFTTQIGDGRAIKLINKIPVVYDFRSQDVLLGGNGAPLVPIGDALLFSQYDACLNLGGFSNISFNKQGKRIAFDICPVNIVLNKFAKNLGKKFDKNGSIAKSGNINEEVLNKLNHLKFYNQEAPKSLGVEWVNENIYAFLKGLSTEDALATFTQHAAEKIADTANKFKLKNILVTGGGVYNDYLIAILKQKTKSEIVVPEENIIHFKEALIFGFMGVLRLNNEMNVLCSSTGSRMDHCSGLLV